MSGRPDIADILLDRRMLPPEPGQAYGPVIWTEPFDICPDCENPYEPHSSWCPTHPSEGHLAERAYYDGEDGHPCPVCEWPKPEHNPGCYMAGDFGPSYRLTPADFQPGGRHFDKENY